MILKSRPILRFAQAAVLACLLPCAAVSAADPATLLAEGKLQDAWAAVNEIEKPSAQDLAIAGKAALARAKNAPLLAKKKWAKRGRNAYQAALVVDESNADALLGLATFALRAPDGLGGGEDTLDAYRSRLLDASPVLSMILAARVALEESAPEALDHYEVALMQRATGDAWLAEYLNAAGQLDAWGRAYAFLKVDAEQAGCRQWLLSHAAEKAGAGEAVQLDHLTVFLASNAAYCNRRPVRDQAIETAQALAASLGPDHAASLEQVLAQAQAQSRAARDDERSR